MATGDVTLFEEFVREIGEEIHNFPSDTLKCLLVDNGNPPAKTDATPRLASYVGDEVGTGGGYTANGETLTSVDWLEAAGVATLRADSFTLAQNGAGFTDAYWAIIYNDTAAADQAICFIELGGPVSEVAGDVTIKFDGAAVGAPGAICTHSD